MMKKIGILGGLAWPSTVEYYAGICRLVEQQYAHCGLASRPVLPEIIIDSLDAVTAASLFGNDADEDSWKAFDAYHRAGLQRLERGGAEFAVIACNTAHHRFAAITRGICIPVLNIVEAAARVCAWTEVHRLLMLGTPPVMGSLVFRQTFARQGIEACAPRSERDLRVLQHTIEALQRGDPDGARERITEIAAHALAQPWPEDAAVYLGCTELPLAFPAHRQASVFTCAGIRYVNSTALHIRAAVEYATSPAHAQPMSAHADRGAGAGPAPDRHTPRLNAGARPAWPREGGPQVAVGERPPNVTPLAPRNGG